MIVFKDLLNIMKLNMPTNDIQRVSNPSYLLANYTLHVINLLKSKSELRTADEYERVQINAYQTSSQREHMKIQRQEFQQKRDSAQNNWIIRYIQSMMSLVYHTMSKIKHLKFRSVNLTI